MADTTQESVIFELKLNAEQYRTEQKLIRDSLGQLVLDIDKTKAAQKELQKAREAGKVSDADYSRQTVALREQLKGQQADYRDLSKGLENSQRVMQSGAGSIVQLRARLSELTTEWNNLTAAERDNSEEGQRLQAEARAVSDELKKQEGLIGDNRRNVGGYAQAFKQGLVGIVAELAKVTAAQKGVDAATEQGQRLQQQRIGFQTAAQRAAAQAGITDFAQAQATIEQYAQALAPAAENLVRLQQEQQQVGQTAGEASQEYQQLGFRVAGAEKELTDLVAAQQAAGQASQAGGAAAQQQGQAVQVAANSLAGMRQRLVELQNLRETFDPTTQEAKELNTTILQLQTDIAIGSGKVDEFGEKIKTNIRKENWDTVADAISGVSGATAVATLIFGDNANAAAAQAKAMQLMTIAQSARSIAIGIDSAKDAAQIILLKAKSLLFKQQAATTAADTVSTGTHAAATAADTAALEAQAGAAALAAEAQVAGTEAAVAGTVAAGAQAATTGGLTVATEAATVAAEGFAAAFALTGIGTVLVLLAALVGALFFYSKASDSTKEKINRFVEVLFRFGTPIGLLLTGLGKLYDKVEFVRKAVDPLIAGFKALGHFIGENARELGEWIGVLDTADERAAKFAAAQLERGQALREQADAEVKAIELAGATSTEVTQARLKNLDELLSRQREANRTADIIHQRELTRIRTQLAAGEELSDADKKLYEERQKGETALINLLNERQALINEGIERERAARQQQAKDVQTDAQRAVQNLQARLERQDAAENAAARRRLARLDLALSRVRQDSVEEVALQRQKVQAQADLDVRQARQTLVEKVRLRQEGYAAERAALVAQEKQALQQATLTEQQRNAITDDYRQQRLELEEKYSLDEARRAVANIPLIQLAANNTKLKLSKDFLRKEHAAELTAAAELTRAELAQAQEGSQQRYNLALQLINQEEQAALAGLNRRAMSEADYQARVTAITADAVAQRKALGQSLTDQAIGLLGQEQQAAELNQQLLLVGKSQAQQADVRASQQYHNQLLTAEVNRHAAALLATREGTKERENAERQHALNLQQIEADTAQAQVQLVVQKYEQITQTVGQSLAAIGTIQDAATQEQLNRIQQESNAEGTSQARRAVLARQQERIEKAAHERKQKFAIAQAVIDGGSAIVSILAQYPKFDFGIAAAAAIALSVVTTAAQIRAISSQKFAAGGIVDGPSHARGGVQLYHRSGAHLGEMEGGEAIMTRGAVQKFGPLLSTINQMGGGRAFAALAGSNKPFYLEGGIVRADALPQVRAGGIVPAATQQIDYELLTDMMAVKLASAFVSGARALPAPETNLTELRQRMWELDNRANENNI